VNSGHPTRAFTASSDNKVVYLFVLINLCITIPLAYKLNIWIDEAYTLHTTSRGVIESAHRALTFELQAPLYFALMSLWRKLSGSVFFARLFSILCIALTVRLAAPLARRYLPGLHPAWLAAAIALHPFAVWAAVEIRVYALVLLLASLLLLLFFDGFIADPKRRRSQVLYTLLSIVALYTHYYLGFLLAANGVVLLVSRRRQALRSYAVAMAVVGACFVPMLTTVLAQSGSLGESTGSKVSFARALKFIGWRIYEFAFPAESLAQQAVRRWIVRAGVVVAIAVFVVESIRRRSTTSIRDHARELASHTTLWLTTIVVAVLLFCALLLTGEGVFVQRHSATLFIPLLLLELALVAAISKRIAPALSVWAAVFFAFCIASLWFTYAPLAKQGDWSRVAAHIQSREAANEPILVFNASDVLPFGQYYRGRNLVVPVPRENRLETYDIRRHVIKNEQEIDEMIARLPAHERVWLVTPDSCQYFDLDFNCRYLEAPVERLYEVEESTKFYRSNVRLLRRKGS
jgi:uncharacterized membrane protein